MHGHWAKGYLRDGKEIKGGGGGGEGPLIVNVNDGVADKTFGEIEAAIRAGRLVTLSGYQWGDSPSITSFAYVAGVSPTDGASNGYIMIVNTGDETVPSLNDGASANDYPSFEDGK